MNRIQLVQVIVIITAIVLGYQMINSFIFFASSAVSYFAGSSMYSTAFAVFYGLSSLLFAIALFIVINNATKISAWIIEKVQPDENMQLGFSDTSVLYGILLFLTLGTLLRNIPAILYDLFELFLNTAGGGRIRKDYVADMPGFNWPRLIESVIAFVLLVNIKPVANYFRKKIEPDDPHFVSDEIEPVTENK